MRYSYYAITLRHKELTGTKLVNSLAYDTTQPSALLFAAFVCCTYPARPICHYYYYYIIIIINIELSVMTVSYLQALRLSMLSRTYTWLVLSLVSKHGVDPSAAYNHINRTRGSRLVWLWNSVHRPIILLRACPLRHTTRSCDCINLNTGQYCDPCCPSNQR